jgi:aminopeptidase N
MLRRLVLFTALLCFGVAFSSGSAAAKHSKDDAFELGAPGVADEYFPLDGNGGYDVKHYDLDLASHPATDTLTGVARIEARATQNLSSLNLDFDDLTVRSVRVNGDRARWTHADGELTIRPSRGLRDHKRFAVRIAYDGVPQTLADLSGFFHTDDGALEVGQPHGAATRYPSNDHPSDKASYTFEIAVPRGLEAISYGEPERASRGRQDDLDLEGPRADGLVPRDDGHR